MSRLYLQCEKAQGSCKDWYKVNVPCIVDPDHYRILQ